MRSFAPLRLASQLCFFCSILCFFPALRPCWPLFALLAALAFAAALLARRLKSPVARLALSLLPALALPLVSDWMGLAVLVLTVLYTAAVLAAGRFSAEPWQYRRELGLLALVSFVLFLISLLFFIRDRYSTAGLGFSGACVLLGLLALRALQLGRSSSPAWELGNVGLFLLPMAGGALLGAALWYLFPLLEYPVKAVGAVIGGVMFAISSFFNWLLKDAAEMYEEVFPTETMEEITTNTGAAVAPTKAPSGGPGLRAPAFLSWELILFVAAALALLLLVLWLFRRARRPEAGPAREQADYEANGYERRSRALRLRRHRRAPISTRDRIRAVYRQYLSFLRRHGVRPGRSATTADVSGEAAELLRESDEALRSLYRLARYGGAEPSEAEAEAAEAALVRLLREENLRSGQEEKQP